MARELQELSLRDIAPPSLLQDKNVQALIKAVDPELHEISENISEVFIYSRIDKLPEPVLDLLAWQWHVDFYELAKNIDTKREMVKSSIKWHRHKGTRGAIIQALEMLGVEAKFTAWYEEDTTLYPTAVEPPDEDKYQEPYTFAIDAKLTGDFWERVDWSKPTQTIRRAITESKAARSYMSKIFIHFEDKASQNIQVGTGVISGVHHKINIDQKTHAESNSDLSVGASAFTGVYHVVDINQKTHSEAKSNIQVGADIFAGVQHAINIKQATQAKTRLKVIAGGNVIQSAHYVIGLKQPDTQHIKQNIFNGGGVLSGTVWRNGFNQRRP